MGKLLGDEAIETAVALAKAALDGGAIKLIGATSESRAESHGAADAKYLATLFNHLYDQIRHQE